MTRRHLAAALCVAWAGVAPQGAQAGERVVAEVDWATTAPLGEATRAEGPDGAAAVRAQSPDGAPSNHPLVHLERPAVTGTGYALVGQVRHEGVAEGGHLEMWSVFESGERYFSRTLAAEGPLRALRGDSDWREFRLPFFLQGAPPPVRLEVNVVLPGAGTVWVGPLRLVQLDAAALGGATAGAWWDDATGGWIGGIGGSVIGLLGGLIGVLCSLGRGRTFVLGALRAGVVVGLLAAGFGLYALAAGQPYAVWYPLLLGGALLAGIDAALLPTARRRYEALELQRMRAMDAVPGLGAR